MPRDLPLPGAAYATDISPIPAGVKAKQLLKNNVSGANSAIFVVKAPLDTFLRYVLRVWPRRGWEFGRGEVERREAESLFSDGRGRVGAIRANGSAFCDQNITAVLLYLRVSGP